MYSHIEQTKKKENPEKNTNSHHMQKKIFIFSSQRLEVTILSAICPCLLYRCSCAISDITLWVNSAFRIAISCLFCHLGKMLTNQRHATVDIEKLDELNTWAKIDAKHAINLSNTQNATKIGTECLVPRNFVSCKWHKSANTLRSPISKLQLLNQ